MKKKLFVSVLAVVLFLNSVSGASAQKSGVENNILERQVTALEKYLTDDVLSRTPHTSGTLEEVQGEIVRSIFGGKPISVAWVDGKQQIVYSGGAVGGMTKAIAMMYGNPPATTERFVADVLNSAKVNIAQPVYAQGLGFASLDPILETWKMFRNIAYLFFVVIFLVIGFMIMLRKQVGQTAVTAQLAIKHVVVALLAVTFSYAIAGLLIDAMYILMYLLIAVFGIDEKIMSYHIFSLGWQMIVSGADVGFETMERLGEVISVDSTAFWQATTGAIAGLAGITAAVVIAIAVLLNIFKLFFELIKIYVEIILNVAFSPILLMLGAIPGKNEFGRWIKTLVGNLIVFPTILLILIVYDKLTGGFSNSSLLSTVTKGTTGASDLAGGGFLPPFILGDRAGAADFFPILVGLGLIMIMPDIVKKVKDAIAPAGMFDQLVGNLGESVKRGWSGGEIIPGVGFTDTSKWPLFGSGQDMARKLAVGVGGTAGSMYGAGRYAVERSQGKSTEPFLREVALGVKDAGIRTASTVNDPHLSREAIDKLQARRKSGSPDNKEKRESQDSERELL